MNNTPKNIEEFFTLLVEEGDVWQQDLINQLTKEQLIHLVWRFTAEIHGYEDLDFKQEVGLLDPINLV